MAICVDREKCIGCESCVAVCPVGAISMVEGKADINQDVCISCGACIGECPVEAISREEIVREVKNNEGKDLWVNVELENGEPVSVVYELLGVGADLAAKSGQRCCAVLIAKEVGEIPAKLFAAGADVVYAVTGAEFADYNTDFYTNAFCELAQEYKPNAVLCGATVDGRDLAPRIAARLGTGLCADCTALDVSGELVEWTRPALGGNILATIICDEHRPQMGTVRPKVFKAKTVDNSRSGEVVNYSVKNTVTSNVEIVRKEELTASGAIKIEDAEIVCAGGRGMGCSDNFKLLEELAALFENGTIGGSRAVVDEGWLEHSHQVGQSGKTVTPKIYFAFGISGAIQHLAGMSASDVIIAINKDANAPIFKVAQYGIVGDACTVLPKLIEKIKKIKEA